jgi:integrase
VRKFLFGLKQRKTTLSLLAPRHIDRFVVAFSESVGPKTLSGVCSSIRCFLRFVHATGRTSADLSLCVPGSPSRRIGRAPPRALSWPDVRRILGAIDRKTNVGKRDYAAVLMMATYGMGGAELLGLRLEDVDWHAGTLRVIRPKTDVETLLPLLGPVAKALSSYLLGGRYRNHASREIFLSNFAPHSPISVAALRLRLQRYAETAHVSAPLLGTHSLRHSHATLQIEIAAPTKVVSDILGHSDPSSISAYARVATNRLRAICLPVPG